MRRGMNAALMVALMASVAACADPITRDREGRDDGAPSAGGKKVPGQMEARLRAAEEKRLRKNAKRLRGRAPA